ncbi:MAG: hypothetical protein HN530_10390 [Gammaproteobacteria bacterium]|jgi:hypothetical protein|nr:hypothetical protein [Gammaproteobacteria bacterium]
MIRISILTLAALCFSLTTQADNHGFDNFIEVELTVSTITMNDAGMVITYEGMAGKYGLVHATHNMVSTNDANAKGYFTGTVQAIDDTGALESSMTLGLWSRDGTQLKVYGFDDDSPTRILHISTVDLRAKTFQAKVWELD